jgi:hypothetical protein
MRFADATVADIMGLWPSDSQFAREASTVVAKITPNHAATMKMRNSIPVNYWPGIVAAAAVRAEACASDDDERALFEMLTYELLTLMHARRPESVSAGAPAP